MITQSIRSTVFVAAWAVVALGRTGMSHSESLDEVLQRLRPISLDEATLRQIAGKDGFKPYVLNPMLTVGMSTLNEWDAGALGSASVVKVDGVFHLYYEAWGKLSEKGKSEEYDTLQIGHAVSLDGVHWAKDPANPIVLKGAEREWDDRGTWDPFVIYEDGVFKMWYGGNTHGGGGVGYAVSRDGSRFEKRGRFSNLAEVEDIHVARDPENGEYLLYFWDRDRAPWAEVMKGPPAPSGLFVARSKDETSFNLANAQRIAVEGQAWPAKYTHVFPYKDRWAMFYGTAVTRGNPSSTGIAFSDDGLSWNKSAFPIVVGHDAEVIEAASNLWLIYYGPDKFFDWPECDLRVAIYDGTLERLTPINE